MTAVGFLHNLRDRQSAQMSDCSPSLSAGWRTATRRHLRRSGRRSKLAYCWRRGGPDGATGQEPGRARARPPKEVTSGYLCTLSYREADDDGSISESPARTSRRPLVEAAWGRAKQNIYTSTRLHFWTNSETIGVQVKGDKLRRGLGPDLRTLIDPVGWHGQDSTRTPETISKTRRLTRTKLLYYLYFKNALIAK